MLVRGLVRVSTVKPLVCLDAWIWEKTLVWGDPEAMKFFLLTGLMLSWGVSACWQWVRQTAHFHKGAAEPAPVLRLVSGQLTSLLENIRRLSEGAVGYFGSVSLSSRGSCSSWAAVVTPDLSLFWFDWIREWFTRCPSATVTWWYKRHQDWQACASHSATDAAGPLPSRQNGVSQSEQRLLLASACAEH